MALNCSTQLTQATTSANVVMLPAHDGPSGIVTSRQVGPKPTSAGATSSTPSH